MEAALTGEVTVRVEADGLTTTSMSPTDRRADLLRAAIDALQLTLDRLAEDMQPVTCSVCGAPATGITARIDGTSELQPCGHPA